MKRALIVVLIRNIDEVRGHTLRNVLIGLGIGVAVLVGTCAASLSSAASPRASKRNVASTRRTFSSSLDLRPDD